MRKIVIYPDKVLRKKCEVFDWKDLVSRTEVGELVEVLMNTKNGAGLSAPQVGISKRFFAIKNEKENTAKVYLNPEITDTFKLDKQYFTYTKKDGSEEPFLEGCLSIPMIYGEVARWPKIAIKYQNLAGEHKAEVIEGYPGIVFQHELDHINGILFIDHVKQGKTKLLKDTGKELVEISFAEL